MRFGTNVDEEEEMMEDNRGQRRMSIEVCCPLSYHTKMNDSIPKEIEYPRSDSEEPEYKPRDLVQVCLV